MVRKRDIVERLKEIADLRAGDSFPVEYLDEDGGGCGAGV